MPRRTEAVLRHLMLVFPLICRPLYICVQLRDVIHSPADGWCRKCIKKCCIASAKASKKRAASKHTCLHVWKQPDSSNNWLYTCFMDAFNTLLGYNDAHNAFWYNIQHNFA